MGTQFRQANPTLNRTSKGYWLYIKNCLLPVSFAVRPLKKTFMARFEVLSGAIVIGRSELETGDAPMGVASGQFFPMPPYAQVQPAALAARDDSQSHLALSVRLIGGTDLPAQGGVKILDYSPELGPEALEVHVIGIGYPLYEELFPLQVAAYESKFPKQVNPS
jgi:hypothetical protein